MMQQPVKFEAYNLEELCHDFSLESGSSYFEYLRDDIVDCEMDNNLRGMEYSLVYMKSIIEAMENRLEGYSDDVEDWENELLESMIGFMKNKDEQILVYLQGY